MSIIIRMPKTVLHELTKDIEKLLQSFSDGTLDDTPSEISKETLKKIFYGILSADYAEPRQLTKSIPVKNNVTKKDVPPFMELVRCVYDVIHDE